MGNVSPTQSDLASSENAGRYTEKLGSVGNMMIRF